MNIKELAKKYSLEHKDFWNCHGNWIISHNAVEKIMAIENIAVTKLESIYQTDNISRFIVEVCRIGDDKDYYKGDRASTIGEASKENCKNSYYGAMAEKRGIDRAVLKLINAYEYGIYSDVEADDFKYSGDVNKRTPEEQKEDYRLAQERGE